LTVCFIIITVVVSQHNALLAVVNYINKANAGGRLAIAIDSHGRNVASANCQLVVVVTLIQTLCARLPDTGHVAKLACLSLPMLPHYHFTVILYT